MSASAPWPPDPEFLGEVAKALAPAKAILICGPGKARTELAGYLKDHTPAIAKRIWGIEPMDHHPIARSSPPRQHTSAPRIACTPDRPRR